MRCYLLLPQSLLSPVTIASSTAPSNGPSTTTSDPLAVEEAPVLVAVVEAKAGATLYEDLPRLLDARTTLMAPSSKLTVRLGRHGPTRTLHVAAASSPHVCYVFGVRGSLMDVNEERSKKLFRKTVSASR